MPGLWVAWRRGRLARRKGSPYLTDKLGTKFSTNRSLVSTRSNFGRRLILSELYLLGSFFLDIAQPRLLPADGPEDDAVIDAALFERLKDQLQCQICAGVYAKPQNVRTCLHKFCEECIDRYNKQM